ncbi:MAG: helix-turn-helix transcriptional regulator [Gallionellaceae bacterium]
MATTPQNTPAQFYRITHLKQRLGISGSHIWNLIKQGKFPAGIKLSDNVTAWSSEAVDKWAQERIAASQKAGV